MMLTRRLLTLFAVSLAAVTAAQAIDIAPGFPSPNPAANSGSYNGGSPIDAQLSGLGATGPYGSYDASNVGFAAWEKWATGSFTSLAPQYTGASGLLNVSLTQSNTGAGVSTTGSNPGQINVGGTDYFGRLTTGGYDFVLAGSSELSFSSLTLQIKHTPFFDAEFNPITAFTATLNGIASEPVVKGPNLGNYSDAISMAGTANVYTYVWNDLNIGAGETFALAFASGEDQLGFGFSVDSVAINVAAVPEPSTYGVIIAGGLLALVIAKRRRRSMA